MGLFRMKNGIIFDLGNTLVQYFSREEFSPILDKSLKNVSTYLEEQFEINIDNDIIKCKVKQENYEFRNHKVRPLEERLFRIFQLRDLTITPKTRKQIYRQFLQPIFERSKVYEDTIPILNELKLKGCKLGIISNMPWGSPSEPWKEELDKIGILEYIDKIVFCSDIGWRKPSPKIFYHMLYQLELSPKECIFIGDEPIDDVKGAEEIGIQGVLIDRTLNFKKGNCIKNLHDLLELL